MSDSEVPVADDADAAVSAEEATEEVVAETAEVEAAPVEDNSACKIYIGNLPNEYSQDNIVEFLEGYGEISEIAVPVDRFTGNIRGFAFVTLANEENAKRAIEELNGKEAEGRIIAVNTQKKKGERPARTSFPVVEGTKLYVGNIPFESTVDELTDLFSQHGTVNDVFVPMDSATNRPRGFAFVTMAKSDADNAIDQTNGLDFNGRRLQVNVSLPRGQAPPNRRSAGRTKLYVGNLSFDTDEETLRDLFGDYGEIHDVYIPVDRERGDGRMRGFAFVTMESGAAERAAEETDGFELYGRILRVNEAQPKGRQQAQRRERFDDGGYDGGNDDWGSDSDNSWDN